MNHYALKKGQKIAAQLIIIREPIWHFIYKLPTKLKNFIMNGNKIKLEPKYIIQNVEPNFNNQQLIKYRYILSQKATIISHYPIALKTPAELIKLKETIPNLHNYKVQAL